MKRLLLVAATAALALNLAACERRPARHVEKHVVQITHFKDGRTGYADATGVWWWLIANNGSSSWQQGGTPDPIDVADAVEEALTVVTTTTDGAPISEAAAPADAGGGVSLSSAGPTDVSPSVPESAPAADASSSSDSGGGDAGGGGGAD